MSNLISMLVLTVVFFAAAPLGAQETSETVGLEMDTTLGERSLQKIADGSASAGQSRLTPRPPSSNIRWPVVGLAGAIALGLAGFGAGVMLGRRKTPQAEAGAPVALWLDAEQLQAELEKLQIELDRQQRLNEEQAADREQLLMLHADQLHELRGDKEALTRELSAIRLRGDDTDAGLQDIIDELREEIAQLRGADDDGPDLRQTRGESTDGQEMQDQLGQQRGHIEQLEEMLRVAHDENSALEQRVISRESQFEAVEATLSMRDDELEQMQAEIASLRAKAERLDEKESHVATLDQELTTLRDEMNELLGRTGQYQALIPELETRLFHREEQIGALESDLDATSFEVAERDRIVEQWEAQVRHLKDSLQVAEQTIAGLEEDLASSREQNQLLSRDPGADELHREIVGLKNELGRTGEALQKAQAELAEVELHRKRVDEWNSTVASLQSEIRRKSTLIDSQADYLASRERQIEQLQAEMEGLRKELADRDEESHSLRDLLEQAGDVVVSLRDEMSEEEHAATRLRLAQDPRQDPFSQHEDAIDAVEADIEALRFTSRSRRDLADSLETILDEERSALEQASRRVSVRDEELIALKNELSANRLSMLVLQSRLNEMGGNIEGMTVPAPMEPARIERELQQSMRVLEALRADLHKWRGRVKPLHEALVSRNERIHALEAEVAALKNAQGLDHVTAADARVEDVADLLDRARNGETAEQERSRTLDEMKRQWDRIVSLETDLADTGARLARVLELDDVRCRQIESLEMARAAQLSRFAELRAELSEHGIDPEMPVSDLGGNVVDLDARRPS